MAKTQAQVMEDVNQIFREVLNSPTIQLKYETTAREVKKWDSLSHIELVVAIEKHFNIRFNFAELQEFKNVGAWCDNITVKLAANSATGPHHRATEPPATAGDRSPGPTSFFEELIQADPKLQLDYEHASTGAPESAQKVRAVAAAFLESYANFNHISKAAITESYRATARRYANDIAAFVATGKYPLQLDPGQPPLSRTDYDVFLILTILVTKHRCAVMEHVARFPAAGNALVIGVGSGVELSFIGSPAGVDAFDLYINPFARQAFPKWRFSPELYRPSGPVYDAVYAIELLEHLEDPYGFLADCRASLAPAGRLLVTTAANVPQFDHTVNFDSDEAFEARCASMGLAIEHKSVIPHAYPRTNIDARNVFYALARNG